MRLTTIINTRGRPDLLRDTVEATVAGMTEPETRLIVAVDEDDEVTLNDIAWLPRDKRVLLNIEAREDTRGPKCDRALRIAPADIYMPVSDYTPIHRPGWDAVICEAAELFPEGIGCVQTLPINANFAGIQAPTAKLVELMGYIYPPHFPFWFIDHWLDDIVRMTGRAVTVDIGSDHFSLSGQRKTIGLREVGFWCDYYDALTPERFEQANRIIEALDETPATKRRLRSNFPTVDVRSRHLNFCVKTRNLPDNDPPDERYLRVKAKAVEHLKQLNEGN